MQRVIITLFNFIVTVITITIINIKVIIKQYNSANFKATNILLVPPPHHHLLLTLPTIPNLLNLPILRLQLLPILLPHLNPLLNFNFQIIAYTTTTNIVAFVIHIILENNSDHHPIDLRILSYLPLPHTHLLVIAFTLIPLKQNYNSEK